MSLTLIIFECEGFDPKLTEDSAPHAEKVLVLKERDLSKVSINTEWFGYLMANERIDEQLSKALPVFFDSDWECLVLFKIGPKVGFITPRFFRKGIEFEPGNLYPKAIDSGNVRTTRVLNGLIVDAPNGSDWIPA
jgi:hypothetical protein